jgi:hypothetical protein
MTTAEKLQLMQGAPELLKELKIERDSMDCVCEFLLCPPCRKCQLDAVIEKYPDGEL